MAVITGKNQKKNKNKNKKQEQKKERKNRKGAIHTRTSTIGLSRSSMLGVWELSSLGPNTAAVDQVC